MQCGGVVWSPPGCFWLLLRGVSLASIFRFLLRCVSLLCFVASFLLGVPPIEARVCVWTGERGGRVSGGRMHMLERTSVEELGLACLVSSSRTDGGVSTTAAPSCSRHQRRCASCRQWNRRRGGAWAGRDLCWYPRARRGMTARRKEQHGTTRPRPSVR